MKRRLEHARPFFWRGTGKRAGFWPTYPGELESMGDRNLSSERRAGLDADAARRAVRRRMAHALGAAGLLGTVALAVAAFAPRMSLVSDKAREHWFDVPASHAVLPTPAQAPRAAPIASVAESPQAATANAVEPSAVLAPTTPETPPIPAPTTPEASPVPAPTTPETPTAPQVTATAAERARLASVPRRPRQEPPLTPREIERRKQRYELWLRREGLERIH